MSTNWLLHSPLEFSVCIMYNVFLLVFFQWKSWEEKSRSPKDQNVYKFRAEDKNHNLFTRTISLKEEIVNRAEFKIKWLFPKRDCVFRPKLMTACSEYFVKFNTPLSRNKQSYRFVAFMFCSEYFVKFNTPLSRNKQSYRFVAFLRWLKKLAT